MKRIRLPNDGEAGWRVDPSSAEQVIEAKLRRHQRIAKIRRSKGQPGPTWFKKGALGLSDGELAMLRWEAENRFFNSARLPEELRDRRAQFRERHEDRIARFQKMPEQRRDVEIAHEADSLAVGFARGCEEAIAKATGEFADMLTQAVIARRGRKDFPLPFRVDLWTECINFGIGLADEKARIWCGNAWGHAPSESALPHLSRIESSEQRGNENKKFVEPFAHKLKERLRHGSSAWLDEAERRIALRCLLSQTSGRRQSRDAAKEAIAKLLVVNPGLSTNDICRKLDNANERDSRNPVGPLPANWRREGIRLWIDALEKFSGRVKTYISKVRRQVEAARL